MILERVNCESVHSHPFTIEICNVSRVFLSVPNVWDGVLFSNLEL